MRIMAVDYGDVRTGIAVSDLTGMICGEAFTIEERNMERLSARIADEVRLREVSTIILGLPLNMDGTEGPRAEKSRRFGEILERDTGIPVHMRDESRTSIEAHEILRANGKREKKHKKNVDAVAASLILESYLEEK